MSIQPADIVAGKLAQIEIERGRLRTLSDRERGLMIKAACRLAVAIHTGRVRSGLPPATPDPWPASTWEFLRRHAPNARRS